MLTDVGDDHVGQAKTEAKLKKMSLVLLIQIEKELAGDNRSTKYLHVKHY
jgi:hypothetical protein